MSYEAVMSPFTLKGVELRNRIVRTAHGTHFTMDTGMVNDDLIAYHLARARGGVALSFLEYAAVHPTTPTSMNAWNEEIVDGWGRLADAVHTEGMKMFAQVFHGGHNNIVGPAGPPWSVSTVPGLLHLTPPLRMTKTMIEETVGAFAAVAERAKRAGLDGLEVHGAHGYLLGQFLSPYLNDRDDEYGGSLENRLRLTIEVLRAVRDAVGADYPVGIRLSNSDQVPGGLTVADTVQITRALEATGLLDFVDISTGLYQSLYKLLGTMYEDRRYEMPDSAPIVRATTLPTIVTGRFLSLDDADATVRNGEGDLISMVRALIAEPNLIPKTLAGAAPRPCISCNTCVASLYVGHIWCKVNPSVGREAEAPDDDLGTTDAPKRVVVAGGGPAGLEAARVAATRGHEVVLLEASAHLGGQVRFARAAPGRAQVGEFADWLAAEVERLGVKISTQTPATVESIRNLGPVDVVICAVGPKKRDRMLQIERPDVNVTAERIVSSWDLLTGAVDIPRHAVVVDDVGHVEGIATAHLLLEQGAEVSFVSRAGELMNSPHMAATNQHKPVRQRLFAYDTFTFLPYSYLTRHVDGEAEIRQLDTDRPQIVPADAVVPIGFHEPNHHLAEQLRAQLPEIGTVSVIGDAFTQQFLHASVTQAHLVARAL